MNDRVQCVDLAADRALGQFWEHQFCKISAQFGRSFTAHQIGRSRSAQAFFHHNGKYHPMTLPDITVWTAPGEHHEVKHKDPSKDGYFGLEKYRLEALVWFLRETKQRVYYTIHDYKEQRGITRIEKKLSKENNPLHWVTCDIEELAQTVDKTDLGPSWVGGEERIVPRCYWRVSRFTPLFWIWEGIPQRDLFGRRKDAA
jgi:hypothetical protein